MSAAEIAIFSSDLSTLDASLNNLINCAQNNADAGNLVIDPNTGSFYSSYPGSISCSVGGGGSIGFGTLLQQVRSGISSVQLRADELNKVITTNDYNGTRLEYDNLNARYKSVLEKRQNLDNKMRELYAISRSDNDIQIQTDSAIYGALLWTALATSFIYYVFVKL
jgi:hypothetical protein